MLVRDVSNKHKGKSIGYNRVNGTYSYVDDTGRQGETVFEKSLIIYNIDKDEALYIANELNQESIVWKDKDFLGLIFLKTGETIEFNNFAGKNMNFSGASEPDEDGNIFGTKLANDKNKDRPMGFRFEGTIHYPNGLKNRGKEPVVEEFVFYN